MPVASLSRRGLVALLVLLGGGTAADAGAATVSDRERRCLTLIAYAEAAGEGLQGMAAVMRVVRNRVADPRFGGDACSVALAGGQFQPVTERPVLREALRAPERRNLAEVLDVRSREARLVLVQAWRMAAAAMIMPTADPTRGALYFVNPQLMDPGRCGWFAGLKRTAVIGRHVFMTHHRPGERRGPPALDCATAGRKGAPPAVLQPWRQDDAAARRALLERRLRERWRRQPG